MIWSDTAYGKQCDGKMDGLGLAQILAILAAGISYVRQTSRFKQHCLCHSQARERRCRPTTRSTVRSTLCGPLPQP